VLRCSNRKGMRKFAEQRGLDYPGRTELRALTPALLTGPDGYDADVARGPIGDGLNGTLTHHVFAEGRTRRDSTIVVTSIPEIVPFVRALVCRDRAQLGHADLAQLPAESWQRSEFESVGFNRRYQLFTLVGQDNLFMHELFSPALLSWLSAGVPAGFGFELNDGNLSVFLPGHLEDPKELDGLCSLAASLAARIRKEAMEEEPDSELFREERVQADLAAAIPAVEWDQPPSSVEEAVYAYREVAARRPWVLLVASLWALIAAAVAGALGTLVLSPFAGAGAGILGLLAGFALARLIASIRYRFGSVPMQRVAEEAFVREYARSRALALQNRWAFHSEMRRLAMPGLADHVLLGRLPGSGIDGRFVMFGDAPEMRSRGQEMAFSSDHPLAANAILVRAGRELTRDRAESVAQLPDQYRLEVNGRDLLVWRPIQGNMIRTAAGSDNFCTKAGEVVRRVEAASGLGGGASGTMPPRRPR
jgi:hypothetical protein